MRASSRLRPHPRRLLSSAAMRKHAVVDVATSSDTKGVSEAGNVLLVEKQLQFKPLQPEPTMRVDASSLFAASDDPCAHTAADVGKYFQIEPATMASLFYHTGLFGPDRQRSQLKTAASMVRACGLALRDELFSLEQRGELGKTAGLIVEGARGVGKSTLLNYAAAACHKAGWLVVAIPAATDWTLGLGGRSCQAANQAYRCADSAIFNELPTALQPVDGGRRVVVSGLLDEAAVRTLLLDLEVTALEWGGAAPPEEGGGGARVELGSAEAAEAALERNGEEVDGRAATVRFERGAAAPGEPPLPWESLYEQPDASLHFLLSTYLAHRPTLEALPIRCPHRAAHYASRAAAGGAPTLADILRPVATDEYKFFSDFPLPLRPVFDFLCELQSVEAVPVLLVVDGYNRWEQMTSAREWVPRDSAAKNVDQLVALHAQQLLVPRMLGDLHAYGGRMANGLMLCANTHDSATPPSVPKGLLKRWPQPHPWHDPRKLPAELRAARRAVPPYSLPELQRTLEFYAHVGHLRDATLEKRLEDGRLAKQVHLMTAGVGSDVFKICEAM